MVTSDGYLRSWNADNCQPTTSTFLGQFEKNHGGITGSHWQVYFSPQGAVVAIGLNDDVDKMTLWDIAAGEPLGTIPAKNFWGLAFSPDERLVSGMAQEGITVWRVASAQELWHEQVDRWNWRPAFDPTGRKLAGSAGHIVRVWDSMSGKRLLEDNDESAVAHGVSFDRSGDVIASAWSGGRVKIWDVNAGVQISDIPIQVAWGHNPFLAFNADNSRVIIEDAALAHTLSSFWWRPSDVVREGCRHVAFNLSPEDWSRLGGYYTPSKLTCPRLPVRQ
jgi:WD40 repeat protein